jgi:hypothetical protein
MSSRFFARRMLATLEMTHAASRHGNLPDVHDAGPDRKPRSGPPEFMICFTRNLTGGATEVELPVASPSCGIPNVGPRRSIWLNRPNTSDDF